MLRRGPRTALAPRRHKGQGERQRQKQTETEEDETDRKEPKPHRARPKPFPGRPRIPGQIRSWAAAEEVVAGEE
ncbi:hypothetical protein E2320_003815 [Naja naja]|nr:hypothetical protein E2320_003815 [Naja naja]